MIDHIQLDHVQEKKSCKTTSQKSKFESTMNMILKSVGIR